jgi:hypothetical protein
MGWTGRMHGREMRHEYKVVLRNAKENHVEDQGIDGTIILKWVFRN